MNGIVFVFICAVATCPLEEKKNPYKLQNE